MLEEIINRINDIEKNVANLKKEIELYEKTEYKKINNEKSNKIIEKYNKDKKSSNKKDDSKNRG